jgi:DNA excision repair protein ERCC-2
MLFEGMGIESRFAYESFRPGQRELAQRVYSSCLNGETLIAEAMSGFGKTAGVLSGALTAADELGCKVVYACRTKRQINRVVEEAARIQRKHPLRAASMLAKFDYCLLRRQRAVPRESFGWYCSFNVSNNLCSYFLNVTLTRDFEQLVHDSLLKIPRHSELLNASERAHVCPYEVARLAITQSEMVVVPYHYAFDPRSTPILFDRNSVDRGSTILVVDEAHNIRDFYRGITSATITLTQIEEAAREAEAMSMEEAANALRMLHRTLENAAFVHQGWSLDRASILNRFKDEIGSVWLHNLAFELSASSGAAWGSIFYEKRLPSLILKVAEFLVKLTSADGARLVKWGETLGLIDPEPMRGFAAYLGQFKSAILLSATVNPASLFARSVGLETGSVKTYSIAVDPLVTIKTMVDTGTSTRYKLRSPEMYSKIAERLAAVINSTESGVGIFAPSYNVLYPICEMVSERTGGRHTVAEAPGLSNEQTADLFSSFRSRDDSVLFGVQGGRFSEGEDFEGGVMGTIAVVGLSLPPPTPMLYAEYSCLKQRGETESHMMLSLLPALRKAFQAAGRHVRSPGKRGLVFFFDERFGTSQSQELMPSWLRRDLSVGDLTPSSIESLSRDFWSGG